MHDGRKLVDEESFSIYALALAVSASRTMLHFAYQLTRDHVV